MSIDNYSPIVSGSTHAHKPTLAPELLASGNTNQTALGMALPQGPVICVVRGLIHVAVDQANEVLKNPVLGIYARGDDLVRAVTYNTNPQMLSLSKRGADVDRPEGATVITPLTEAALIETLTRHAQFRKFDARKLDYMPCDCPADVARMILANKGHGWKVPRLRAVISAPTMRPDKSVLIEPGYDEATGLLLVGNRRWQPVAEHPSKRDALAAVECLSHLLRTLPFVANSDRAAALALLITGVARPCLRTVPMFAISAPAAGTGKSMIIDLGAVMATGRRAAVITPTRDEAELEKRIGAAALAGDQIISIDNVTQPLRSDQLCQLLTQEEVQVRVLGASKNVRIPSTSVICATGNNLSVYGDLNRRTIRIRLDAKCERPEERHFDFDPVKLALRQRTELVYAALTILRAYMVAGNPSRAKPMGSFEDWSDTVRSALIWLGLDDCRGDVEAMRADDPEKGDLAEIIDAMPPGRFTAREIAQRSASDMNLRETLEQFMGRHGNVSSKRLGRYLARHAGTIVHGRWIEQVSNDGKHGAVWRIGENNVL